MWEFFRKLDRTWFIVIAALLVVLAAGGIYWTTGAFQTLTNGGGKTPSDQFDDPGSREANNAIVEHTAIISAILSCHDVYDIDAIVEGQQPVLHTGKRFPPAGS